MTQANILVTQKSDFTINNDERTYVLSYTVADPGLRDFVTPKVHNARLGNIADEPNGIFESLQAAMTYYYVDSAEELMTDLNGAQSVEPFVYGSLYYFDEELVTALLLKQDRTDTLDQLNTVFGFAPHVMALFSSATTEDAKFDLDIIDYDDTGLVQRIAAAESDIQTLFATETFSPVITVNGRAEYVVLDSTDVGLENVDNTSDASKPISTATQTALDGKAATSHAHVVSDITDFATATDARITTKINALLNGAGSAYDTLKELQDLIVGDESTASALAITVGNKVDKVTGKGLSTEDYSTAEKTKLSGIATGATAIKTYFGPTLRTDAIMYTSSATVSSGTAVFQLTTDGTSGGTAIFPNGPNMDSINAFVSDATASYQMSYALTNSNKTLTITANKLTTANILTGVLGQAVANTAVVRLTVWGR